MLAFTVLVFVVRYFPRYAPWLLLGVLLMCAGAVYDGYHYAVDVIAGAVSGNCGAQGSENLWGEREWQSATNRWPRATENPPIVGGQSWFNCCSG